MAALTCDICGGKLQGKPGGIFECDSCGMEYNTEWAKAKIQEIRGSVKVEGTVEVTGSVKVEGSVTAENLLQRGKMALADGNWASADEFFDRALDTRPDSAEGWMGKLMASFRCRNEDEMKDVYMGRRNNDPELVLAFPHLEKARRFGDAALRAKLEGWEADKLAYQAEETAARKANEALRETMRRRRDICAGMVTGNIYHIVAVKSDGTVLATGENTKGRCEVSHWTNVVSVIHFETKSRSMTLGLRADGTVIGTKDIRTMGGDIENWTDIVKLVPSDLHIMGLKKDGTVVTTGSGGHEHWGPVTDIVCYKGKFYAGLQEDGAVVTTCKGDEAGRWKEVKHIYGDGRGIAAVKKDGTVLYSGNTPGIATAVSHWQDIEEVYMGYRGIVGVRKDGTLICDRANGRDPDWRDIAFGVVENDWPLAVTSDRRLLSKEPPPKISSLDYYSRVIMAREENWGDLVWLGHISAFLAGIRADGTMLLAQSSKLHDLSGWKLFGSIDTLEQEQAEMAARNARIAEEKAAAEAAAAAAEAARKAKEQRRLTEEKAGLAGQRQAYQTELANLKGLFTGKRRKELEGLIAELDGSIARLERQIEELN